MKLQKAMATVAGMTAISRVLGFLRDILTAVVLGAGPIADVFVVALKLPNFFRRITAEGAFSVSFVPLYSEALEKEGRAGADKFAGNAMVVMFWILLAFTILVMIFMPAVITLVAPGFQKDPARFEMAVTLSRITFPYLLMMSIASLMGGVLNAHNRFAPFAAAPIFFNLSLIALLCVAWFFRDAVAHLLAIGVLVAGILQFLFLYMYIRREGIHLPLGRPHFDARVKRLFKLMGPGAVGAGIVQINLFADMIIGSFLPAGSISYLYYADRLNQLPLSTVGIAVGTALLPMLSRAIGAGKTEEAHNLFNRALEITLFLGLPAAVGLFVLAHPIIDTLFRHGQFSPEAARATAFVLQGYVVGLPAYIGVKVFSSAFWSKQDTLTPVKVAAISALANIALALSLISFLGAAGIALSTGIIGWLQIYLLYRPLKSGEVAKFDARFKTSVPKIALSAAVMGAVLFIFAGNVSHWLTGGFFIQCLALGGLIALGMAIYGGMILLTGALKVEDIKGAFKKNPAALSAEENAGTP